MPLARYLPQGPRDTAVEDCASGRMGPILDTGGVMHGGALSPEGRRAVTLSSPPVDLPSGAGILRYVPGTQTGSVRFWDADSGKEVCPAVVTPSEPVAAAYRPDGRRLAVACARGELLWLDPEDGRILREVASGAYPFDQGVPQAEMLRFTPDGRTLAVWGTRPLAVFDGETGEERTPALDPQELESRRRTVDARFSADGRHLVSASLDKTARVWDLATGRLAAPPLAHPDWVFCACFSADGARVLTGCRDASARVWDWRAGRLVGPPMAHVGEVQFAAFLPGDLRIVTKSSDRDLGTSTDNAVQIWELLTSRPLTPRRLVPSGWGCQFALLPDGHHAAMGSNTGFVQVLDLARWLDPPDARFPDGQFGAIAELCAGQTVVEGSSLTALSSTAWVERWRAVRESLRAAAPPPGDVPHR